MSAPLAANGDFIVDKSAKDNSAQTTKQEAAARDPKASAVDRPGFDLGGSVTDGTAGSGLGLGDDAAENARGRRLPRDGSTEQNESDRDTNGTHADDRAS